MKEVPRIAVLNGISENSDYTNHSYNNKNCYLVFEAGYSENSFYSTTLWYSKDCIDCDICHNSDNCYQCQNITNCSKCFYSRNLTDCYNCYFCFDCIGCKNCFGVTNKINQEYLLYDKKVSKEEFESFIFNYKLFDNKENFFLKREVKNLNNINCENCLGDNLINSKKSFYVFDCNEVENLKYSWKISNSKDSYDYDIWGENSENIYEVHCTGTSNNIMFSNVIWDNSNNIFYSDNCLTSNSNLFGCIGLKNKSYCILNKQYTKEEYKIIVPKIIENMMTPLNSPLSKEGEKTIEWGEFFPSNISPFGYNETVAQEYFPLNREEILKRGFKYSDYESPLPNVEKIIKANQLPENIEEIPDDVLNWAIECEVTKKPFRIIKAELEFYRRHPDQRHLDRMALRNPRKLFNRKCDKCGIDMKTTYSPERPEIVYCEECYNKEVY